MKKVLVFLAALGFAIAGLYCVAAAPYILAVGKGINPRIIDSEADKLFFLLMLWGCGVVYAMISVCLLKKWNPIKYKPVVHVGMIAMAAFLAGIYYHVIFGSPW